MPRSTSNRNISALQCESLEQLALRYVERYATTRGKLKRYLERKLHERGWDGEETPPVAGLVERLAGLGFVDDRQFAEMRVRALERRGYGQRRIHAELRVAGIESDDISNAVEGYDERARDIALKFARKKRIGPFAENAPDPSARRRAYAAMIRAGHPMDIIREILTDKE